MIKDPITTIEAAAILDRDPSLIRHMIRNKQLAFEKRGRDNYVSKKVIEAMRELRESKKNGSK